MEVILTHEHADFDAIAALVGLARLEPPAIAVLPQVVNANVVDFLTLFGRQLPLRHRDELPREPVSRAWLVDTRSANMVRGMTAETPRTVVDHHVDDRLEPASASSAAVGATSTLVTERLAAVDAQLPPIEATLLLLGIHEDTGSLTYAHTTARDARAVAWLLDRGADTELVPRFLRHPLSTQARALQRALVAAAETLHIGGHDVVLAATAAGSLDEEVSGLANRLMELLTPDAVVLVLHLGAMVQVVARSASDLVDVGALARALGGGGHARAAAAVLRGASLAAARERVLAALPLAVRPGRLVSDIMTWGPVRSLDAGLSIGLALEQARQFGHEGYPVVAADTLLGMVSRRDLDLAVHHHLAAEPVTRLVTPASVSVTPGDTVAALQDLMTAHDVGQVPVLEEGRMVGIVTRTDLLKLWSGRAGRRAGDPERLDLAASLAPDCWAAIAEARALAIERGEAIYLVGGVVRDLLLGRPPGSDIDLVVEGDARGLGRGLVERHGGSLRVHDAFGTATWRRAELAIDLITARAEHYSEPTALPSVQPGSLKSDLRRRDFSINALALDLAADREGTLIDPFNGLADLRRGHIRVLHPLSFVEDPTRILRALRYAERLGFTLEASTAARLSQALPLLSRVSGARLLNEMRLALAEPDPAALLARLEAAEVLATLTPGLGPGADLRARLEALPGTWRAYRATRLGPRLAPEPGEEMSLVLWLAGNGPAGERAAARLRLPLRLRELVAQTIALADPGHPVASPHLAPSAIFHALEGRRAEAVVLAAIVSSSETARGQLMRYAAELAGAAGWLSGADLRALGVPPGPVYRQVLDTVRDAGMDGKVADRAAALALARELLRAAGALA